jgi:uncharacterized protein (TIGR03086 family)
MEDKEQIDLLADVLGKTGAVVAGVAPGQGDSPTPCPDYDVATLTNHIVGWVQVFAAGAAGGRYEGDPLTYEAGADPGGEFRAAAELMVAGWREHGFDRKVILSSPDGMDARMAFNMTVMEYLTHGWDLAVATGQPLPYSDDEAAAALPLAEATLPDQYRGEGMGFGERVAVPDDAPALDRFIGFMGRDPGWTP